MAKTDHHRKFENDLRYKVELVEKVGKEISSLQKEKENKLNINSFYDVVYDGFEYDVLKKEIDSKSSKPGINLSEFPINSPEFLYYFSSEFISESKEYDDIAENEDANSYLFSRPIFINSKKKIESMIELFINAQDTVEGIHTCYNCGEKKTYTIDKQTRSGDENSTSRIVCANCGTSWTD